MKVAGSTAHREAVEATRMEVVDGDRVEHSPPLSSFFPLMISLCHAASSFVFHPPIHVEELDRR